MLKAIAKFLYSLGYLAVNLIVTAGLLLLFVMLLLFVASLLF